MPSKIQRFASRRIGSDHDDHPSVLFLVSKKSSQEDINSCEIHLDIIIIVNQNIQIILISVYTCTDQRSLETNTCDSSCKYFAMITFSHDNDDEDNDTGIPDDEDFQSFPRIHINYHERMLIMSFSTVS